MINKINVRFRLLFICNGEAVSENLAKKTAVRNNSGQSVALKQNQINGLTQ